MREGRGEGKKNNREAMTSEKGRGERPAAGQEAI